MTASPIRTARCSCGAIALTVRGEPEEVYLCACGECQRATGSTYTYVGAYKPEAVTLTGTPKRWSRLAESGRRVEKNFCPDCGTLLFFGGDLIRINAGCFADADFAPPGEAYWTSRCHRWLRLGDGIVCHDTQPD